MGKNGSKYIRWILKAAVAIFAFWLGYRSKSKMGFADNQKRGFQPVPGSKTKIITTDQNGKTVVVESPKDPDTGRQYRNDEIQAVGISKTTGEVKVEILHDRVDRRAASRTD
jgi:hypothetical protein